MRHEISCLYVFFFALSFSNFIVYFSKTFFSSYVFFFLVDFSKKCRRNIVNCSEINKMCFFTLHKNRLLTKMQKKRLFTFHKNVFKNTDLRLWMFYGHKTSTSPLKKWVFRDFVRNFSFNLRFWDADRMENWENFLFTI